MADEIDYQLIGDDLQAVIITLDPGEMVIAEAGAMMYMQDGIMMNTTLDPNAQGGGMLSKLFSGAKRALSGNTFFITTFANAANRRQDVAFSSHFPGKIRPVDLREWNGVIIAQKDCFLCAARGINVTIAFTRRIGAGFFGGEGFILQRIEGDGLAFLHVSGALQEVRLAQGESLRVDTGCLAAMDESIDYDIQMVPGIKTALFGGEGLFFARLTGPGRVLLQTMPFSRLADRILAAAPSARGGRRDGVGLGAAGLIGGAIGSMMDDGQQPCAVNPMTDLPNADPIARFKAVFEEAQRIPRDLLPEPTAFALGTVDADGRPSVRIVLLKSMDDRGFVFYTNCESRKGRELLGSKRAALCFHWQLLETQVRVEGVVDQVSDADADAYFATRERGSQIGAWASLQSQRMERDSDLDDRISEIEQRFGGGAVSRPPHWSGFRVVPERIEFWKGMPSRLHLRHVYTREDGSWTVQRLYP